MWCTDKSVSLEQEMGPVDSGVAIDWYCSTEIRAWVFSLMRQGKVEHKYHRDVATHVEINRR
jgi:hypothetical protein